MFFFFPACTCCNVEDLPAEVFVDGPESCPTRIGPVGLRADTLPPPAEGSSKDPFDDLVVSVVEDEADGAGIATEASRTKQPKHTKADEAPYRPRLSAAAAAAAVAAAPPALPALSAPRVEGTLESQGIGGSREELVEEAPGEVQSDDHDVAAGTVAGPILEPSEDLSASATMLSIVSEELRASASMSSTASASTDRLAKPGRSTKFRITVNRSTEKEKYLGLDTKALMESAERSGSQKERGALRIDQVKAEGLIADWNSVHKRRQVREGDFIVEVNGVRGKPDDLYAAIARDSELHLVVLRLPLTTDV